LLFLFFAQAKLSRSVCARIRAVSSYQSRVRELHNSMAVMGEALSRLKAACTQLTVVKNMPRAYHAAIQVCVVRVVRCARCALCALCVVCVVCMRSIAMFVVLFDLSIICKL
jgi:hypothetical protein